MGGLNPPVLPLSNLHRWHIWVLQINVITYANVQNKFSELIAAQTRAVRDVMNISCTDGDQDNLFIKHACHTVKILQFALHVES